jgi:osmoprotectant transport system permease protein
VNALAVKLHAGLPLAQGDGLPKSFFHDRSGELPCQATDALFCPGWAVDNFHIYVDPALKQAYLVAFSVIVGFAIAMGLALLSHRYRRLEPPIIGFTGVLYTIPSVAFFFLLLPVTGFGTDTAVIALSAYTLQIIYRNTVAGLANVPAEARDAGRGMGMTRGQLLWRVELPLAVPEIVAGLRIATVSTMALATLAFFAGAGGLGQLIIAQPDFKTNVILAGGLAIFMAITFDLMLLGVQRFTTPWRRALPG